MPLNSSDYNRYTGTGRTVDQRGEFTPQVEVSESVRPWIKLLPAPYIPVARFDVHKRANIVISTGTPVSLDGNGSAVPGGIPGGHTFVYDSEDFRAGSVATRNANTGAAVAAAGNAIMNSGLTNNTTGYFLPVIGVAAFNYFAHEGGISGTFPSWTLLYDNPLDYGMHNTMAQDLVSVLCDYCLLVPYLPGKNLLSAEVKIFDNTANQVAALTKKAKSYVFAHDEPILQVSGNGGLEVVFVSPTSFGGDNGSSGAVTFGGSVDALTFAASGTTAGSAVDCNVATDPLGTQYILYSSDTSKYCVIRKTVGAGTATTFTVGAYAASLRGIQPGDFVKARVGKFVKWDQRLDLPNDKCGQVLAVDNDVVDKAYMNRVKTAFERSTIVAEQMPGSATRGLPYSLHLVTDGAWRQYADRKLLDNTTAITATGLTTPALRLITINFQR